MSTRLAFLFALVSSAAHADPPPDPGVLDEVHRLQLAVAEAVPPCSTRPGSFSPCVPAFAPPRTLLHQLHKARPRLTDAELAILAGQMERVSIAITSPTAFSYEVAPMPMILSFPCVTEHALRGTGTRGPTITVGAAVQGRVLRTCDPHRPQ